MGVSIFRNFKASSFCLARSLTIFIFFFSVLFVCRWLFSTVNFMMMNKYILLQLIASNFNVFCAMLALVGCQKCMDEWLMDDWMFGRNEKKKNKKRRENKKIIIISWAWRLENHKTIVWIWRFAHWTMKWGVNVDVCARRRKKNCIEMAYIIYMYIFHK